MNHIYAIGGRKNPNEDLSSCERYSPVTNEWKPIAPMKTGRSLAAAADIGHRIFVIGGSEDSGMYQLAIPTNEMYNCLLDEWSLIARCHADRVAPGVCSLANKIYIFGGRNEQQSLTTVEVYDSTTNEWQVTSNCDKLLNTFSISCCVFYLPKKHLQTFSRLTNNAGQNLDC
jgi:N-acetylneuraminic acid mutarotase